MMGSATSPRDFEIAATDLPRQPVRFDAGPVLGLVAFVCGLAAKPG
jgi:hypothetical protein